MTRPPSDAGEKNIRVVDDNVGAEGSRLQRPVVALFRLMRRTEHDAPAEGPGQLGVVDVVSLAVDDGLLEAEASTRNG